MNKIIRWVLMLIAGFLVLLAAVIVSLPFVVNPNDYKGKIIQLVQGRIKRDLTIPGDIKLHVSPRLNISFSLGQIQLASSSDFSDTPFASSKLAEIKLALWPLVTKKQLKVETLTLQGVQLNLIRDKEGRRNWQDLLSVKGNEKKGEAEGEKRKSGPAEQEKISFDIGGMNIKDITVHYHDQQTGTSLSINQFNLKVGRIAENEPFPFTADWIARMDDGTQEALTAAIQTKGELTFNLSEQRFILEDFSLQGQCTGELFPAGKLEFALLADVDIDARAEKIVVKKIVATQGELTAETTFAITGFATPVIEGTLHIPNFSPKAQLKDLGVPLPDFSDPQVMDQLSMATDFKADEKHLEIRDLKVNFDDTVVHGSASINNFKKPAYVLLLDIDQIDLDRYRGKKTAKEPLAASASQQDEGKQKNSKERPILSVTILRNLLFNAKIKVDSCKAAKLKLTDLAIQADGRDGRIHLRTFSANLYDGTFAMSGEIDTGLEQPEIQVKKQLHGVQLGPLLFDMTGKQELSGRADIVAEVLTRGISQDELTRNANGTLTLSLADGKISKLHILKTIRQAKALLEQKNMPEESAAQPTGFATLTATGTMKNGKFSNNDLLAQSDLMKVIGKGTIDFVQEQIDYLLTVYLTDRIEREQGTGLVELGNTPIPYRVKGSFTHLEQSAALEELVKEHVQTLLLDELRKHVGDQPKNKEESDTKPESLLEQGLKGLFGN